jgi:hypothetical protein
VISPGDYIFTYDRQAVRILESDVRRAVDDAIASWGKSAPDLLPPFVFQTPSTALTLRLQFSRYEDYTALLTPSDRDRIIYVVYDRNNVLPQHDRGTMERALAVTRSMPRQSLDSLAVSVVSLPQSARLSGLATFRLTVLHEIGHALGLAHTLLESRAELEAGDYAKHPSIMFPFLMPDTSEVPGPSETASLNYIYSSTAAQLKNCGAIAGSIRDAAGTLVSGATVIAEALDPAVGPDGTATYPRYGSMSGYDDVPGEFAVAVQPGRYRLFAASLRDPVNLQGSEPLTFVGGSRLGPDILKADRHWAGVKVAPEFVQPWFQLPPVVVQQGRATRVDLRLSSVLPRS